MATELTFLGKGLKFPFGFSKKSGRSLTQTSTASDVDKINHSLIQIIRTSFYERFFMPEFGSAFPSLIFELNTAIFKHLVKYYLIDAVSKWEHRIELKEINLFQSVWDAQNYQIIFDIKYTIIENQVEGNLVFPFYIYKNR